VLFVPTKTNKEGDSLYRREYLGWIHCNTSSRCLTKPVKLKWVGQYYKLDSALNNHVEEYGDIFQ
jgi:hypothetical protein